MLSRPNAGSIVLLLLGACTFDSTVSVRATLFALRHSEITVDGRLGEWQDYAWVSISAPEDFRPSGIGEIALVAADHSARVAARWTDSRLYLALEVTDDIHANASSGSFIWQGDSVQVAFDVSQDSSYGYDNFDDFEYGWALSRAIVGKRQPTTQVPPPRPMPLCATDRPHVTS